MERTRLIRQRWSLCQVAPPKWEVDAARQPRPGTRPPVVDGTQQFAETQQCDYVFLPACSWGQPQWQDGFVFTQNNGGKIYSNMPKKITLADMSSTSLNYQLFMPI
jgi:hypothetical protein